MDGLRTQVALTISDLIRFPQCISFADFQFLTYSCRCDANTFRVTAVPTQQATYQFAEAPLTCALACSFSYMYGRVT